MSTFAPDEAMSNPGNHPPLEELAAYIDGMLGEEEAARVAEHISECEDCFFVYSETVRFQLENPSEEAVGAEPEIGEVVLFPSRPEKTTRERTRRWWPAAAVALAAAALAVAIGVSLYRNFVPQSLPQVTTAELIEPVQGIPGVQNQLYKYRVDRGVSKVGSELDQPSFMIGFLFVDLRLSLEGSDVETSRELLRKMGVTVRGIDIFPELGDSIIKRANDLESPADLQRLLPEMTQWETEIRADDGTWMVVDDYFTFGQWAEAGRLAAVHQKPEFFESRENRRVLSYILRSEEMAPEERVMAHLQKIQSLWDKGDLQPQDFATLAEKFKAILKAYDFTA